MQTDWYEKAKVEFMFDGPLYSNVNPVDFIKVYGFLRSEGLIDYDIEKEYLWDKYVEDEYEEDDD